MKKVFMFFAGVAFVASLSSCKKDYTCTCTASGISSTVDMKMTKKDAEAACTAFEIGGLACELKKK